MVAEAELRWQLTLLGLRWGFEASRPNDPNRLIWSDSPLWDQEPVKSE